MHKKALITTLIFLLITGALAGCGDRGGKSEETVEELSGTFVGEAGSLSFVKPIVCQNFWISP